MAELIHVVAAVIVDSSGNILLAKRNKKQHQGGLWEFPGGKVEPGEPVVNALRRELDEELGIELTHCRPLIQVPFHYPDKSVLLDVYQVDSFSGKAFGREGQPVVWVSPQELDRYEFPAANKPIVMAAQLANRMMITGELASNESYLTRLVAQIDSHQLSQVMLRANGLSECDFVSTANAAFDICRARGVRLLVNSSLSLANAQGWSGLHLNAQRLSELGSREQFSGEWLGASCHNESELAMAVDKGVDYVTLSPVKLTRTHPEATALGWKAFEALANSVAIPVYALGGLGGSDLDTCWRSGGQGIAAIGAWW